MDSHPRPLYRSEHNRFIAGVAGGLGEYFQIDPVIFRLLFILFSLSGFGIVVYLLLWLLIPSESVANPGGTTEETVQTNAQEMASQFEMGWRSHTTIGVWLIILGVIFLLANLGFFALAIIWKLWPLILIVIGWHLFVRRK